MQEKVYTSVELAFGYKNKNNEYALVVAILADEAGEIFLVRAMKTNYGNTAELNVTNCQHVVATVNKDEWNK